LAAGVPLLDTLLAIWRRSVRKIGITSSEPEGSAARIMGADMDHLHHRLLRSGLKQNAVAVRLYAFSSILVGMGLLTMIFSSQAVGIFIISFVLATYVIIRHLAHVELWDSGTLLVQGLKRPTQPVLAVMLYPAVDIVLLAVALFIAIFLVSDNPDVSLKRLWLGYLAQWSSIPLIGLIAANTYRRVWSRARAADFIFLALSLAMSIIVTLGMAMIAEQVNQSLLVKLAITYFFVACSLIVGWRALPRLAREIMASRGAKAARALRHRVLIYGAGDRCGLFLKQLGYSSILSGRRFSIVGLIDDDRNLRKRLVFGLTVLGGLDDVERIVVAEKVDELIIACSVPEEKRERLLGIARAQDLKVSHWILDLDGSPLTGEPEPAVAHAR
ncbi:MAG: hypothetical protein KDD44_14060, partial [Bdellovibrionales bacterium]|nr:hypothetical protein [Bdellovibrionales bacterium]